MQWVKWASCKNSTVPKFASSELSSALGPDLMLGIIGNKIDTLENSESTSFNQRGMLLFFFLLSVLGLLLPSLIFFQQSQKCRCLCKMSRLLNLSQKRGTKSY